MNDQPSYQKSLLLCVLLLLSGFAYYFLSYQTARENFGHIISLFTFLFIVYYITYKFFSVSHFKYLFIAGILFRILLIFSIPNLSDDVYRFIWDGRLSANGINPFSYLPGDVLQMPPAAGITKQLYGQLNSPDYYTIYPPVLQGIFWLAGKLFPVNVFAAIVFLKCIIVLFEIATFFWLIQLLKELSLTKHLSLLYIINPLVITELTGNVHFEGIISFFILVSFTLLIRNKWEGSAICLAFAIATKLMPVLFIPLMIHKLGWKKGLLYFLITTAITLVLFAFIFDIVTAQHLLKSIDLFIRKFEFNASIYYVVRWIGTQITGYNIIAFAGPLLSLIAACINFFISFNNKKTFNDVIFVKALFIITTWFLFSTTIHPWYICLPVALAVVTPFRYTIIWSYTATLSYSAYQYNPVHENLLLVCGGYLLMIGCGYYEWKKKSYNNYPKNDNLRSSGIDN